MEELGEIPREKDKEGDLFSERGGFDTVASVRATTGTSWKSDIEKTSWKMKVVKRAGLTLKQILQWSDPFKGKRCDDNESSTIVWYVALTEKVYK